VAVSAEQAATFHALRRQGASLRAASAAVGFSHPTGRALERALAPRAPEWVAVPSTPELEQLREHLQADRALGLSFEAAWAAAHGDLSMRDPQLLAVLAETEDAWRRAYERAPSTWSDWALSQLEGYVVDGEAQALSFELPAA
jgi:hypothetical protein